MSKSWAAEGGLGDAYAAVEEVLTDVESLSQEQLRQLMANREGMYGFLARIYRVEVDQEALDQMAQMDFGSEVDEPRIREGYQMLHQFLAQPQESTVTDLAVDYARVFLGAGLARNEGAFPYESVYTSPHRLIMQDARDQVLEVYRDEGLDRAADFIEPEDHIATELEFMGYLSRRAAEAVDDGDSAAMTHNLEKQLDFLEKHLKRWVPAFCDDVEQAARSTFYRAVAKITSGYLDLDQELLGSLVAELKETTE